MRSLVCLSLVLLTMAPTAADGVEPGQDLRFQVTKVRVEVSERSYTGPCPHRFDFTGYITVNRAGTVRYRWLRSDGARAAESKLVFLGRGTKTVATYWQLGSGAEMSRDDWQAIEILSPNSLVSDRADFTLTCIPIMKMPTYEILGAIDSGPEGRFTAGRQVKISVRQSGSTVVSQVLTLNSEGRSEYRFGLPLRAGRYQLVVESVPYSGPSTLNVCYRSTVPADRWVELTTSRRRAENQDFTIQFVIGWDRGPCW
ncbi:MAG: hypothetical protein SCM96_07680 [Acidobacteriota bacterium]|nr:hypothetical protein [Acidobacteriota bacterium]